MAFRDIIVIGTSAGGVEALTELCRGLPANLPASIFIVQHLAPDAESMLAPLLARAGVLPVTTAKDDEPIRQGHIYVAVPDMHLLLRPGRMILRRGPHENRTRPAVNALFRSAAVAYGSRVVGVVLTGLLDDGTEGLIAIKSARGLSVVQDPADALWPSMPQNALERDHVDYCLPLTEIPALLTRLCGETAGPSGAVAPEVKAEARMAEQEFDSMQQVPEPPGHRSKLTCPQCGGVLNEIVEGSSIRFRCQIGHGFTAAGLAAAKHDEMEQALAIAIRTHRDRMNLFNQMAEAARSRNLLHSAARWHHAAQEAARLARILESAMGGLEKATISPP